MSGAPSIDARGATLAFLREDATTPREVWAVPLAAAPSARPARNRSSTTAATPKALTDTNPQARERLSFPKEW